MRYDFNLDMRERRSHTMILKKIEPGSSVLELGCSTGVMTRYLREALGCSVFVCDMDAEALKSAQRYADGYWLGDLEETGWADEFAGMQFDYILCADVLEHLREPAAVLKKTADLLKEDGSVLLSMPNVAHDSVVYGLLQNRFDYTEVGLLDRTHLRFYTYPSLVRLCLDAGYTPVEEDAVYMDAQPPAGLPDLAANRQYGRVFQFIFELKKTAYAQENRINIVRKIKEYPDDPGGDMEAEKGIKFIAFYLPQFHEIKENNEWWGEGFTEWVNTRKAIPLFDGHRQPREPLGANYYDLTDPETLRWQAGLMNRYGVYGLCFYHYWFSGRMLLQKPAELLLENKGIPMRFCFSWANEPWSRNWDGRNNAILMPQIYGGEEDWRAHFHYLLPFFLDERYIKIDGKPLFVLYVPNQIQRCGEMLACWRQLAEENGLPGLFITETLSSKIGMSRPCLGDSDACIEFEPTLTLFGGYLPKFTMVDTLHLFYYNAVWENMLGRKTTYTGKEKFPGAFAGWDNTPRAGERASICLGSTPEKFKGYLSRLAEKCEREGSGRFIFINAWNEWAEGAYLEPDEYNKYGYLEAVREVQEKIQKER